MALEIGDKVTYPGTRAEWIIEAFITHPGRYLSSGYREPDRHYASLKRADGKYPDFINDVSISVLEPVDNG